MNTQIFHLVQFDLKGHLRSHKVTIMVKNPFLYECYHYEDTFFFK